jgi:hypothetical protein
MWRGVGIVKIDISDESEDRGDNSSQASVLRKPTQHHVLEDCILIHTAVELS